MVNIIGMSGQDGRNGWSRCVGIYIINKNIVEVSYNTQAAVDAKNNLFVHVKATNTNDGKAPHRAAVKAKENMGLKKQTSMDVLSDKGYHTGAELQMCRDDNIQPMWPSKNNHP